jgi:signal transduction histidine kinase
VAVRITQITYQGKVMMLGNLQDMTEHKRMETALRDLSARILNIQEEERRRVARDLHDGICQTLTATRFILEGYLGEPATPERRSSMARLRSLVPILQEAVDEVRRISTDLRPAMLDELGLLATIRWFLGDLQRLHPELEVRSHLQAAESDIPEGLKTNLFRLLQEATSNAIKHSHGTLLDVRLTAEQGVLRLTVEDDGEGFVTGKVTPEAGPGKHHGLGLSSMRERTELSGGTFRVSSMPGAGTSVEARWRLDAGAFSD